MHTTATLTIGNFKTTLTLAGDSPVERINVIGDNGPDYWDRNPAPYFRRNADLLLADRGYERTADWVHDAGSDRHTATLASIPARVDCSPIAAAKADSLTRIGAPRRTAPGGTR